MRKAYEAIRIEPINIGWGTGLNLGGAIGSTAQAGVVDVSKGIGDFTVLVGGMMGATACLGYDTGTAARYVQFAVYEATAATHAGSAITGATVTLGAATAGTLRGLVDAFIKVASDLTTTENLTINGITYHTTLTGPGRDGSAVAAELVNIINGGSTKQGFPKLPHYKANCSTGGVFGASGVIYLAPDDDQGTGLTIEMAAVTGTAVPYMNKVQGMISINGHALSTNYPKWISVVNTTYAGSTGGFYAFLLRRSGVTPGRLISLNT